MKESDVLQELVETAEGIGLKVCTVNIRKYAFNAKSGLCRVEGEYRIIVDKHLHLSEKIDVLVEAIQHFGVDTSRMDPHIKRLIEKKGRSSQTELPLAAE